MKWNKFRLKTTTEAEDIVSSMLMDLGVQGIEIEDKIPMTQAEKKSRCLLISFRRQESMTASHISVSIWKKMKIKKVFWKL